MTRWLLNRFLKQVKVSGECFWFIPQLLVVQSHMTLEATVDLWQQITSLLWFLGFLSGSLFYFLWFSDTVFLKFYFNAFLAAFVSKCKWHENIFFLLKKKCFAGFFLSFYGCVTWPEIFLNVPMFTGKAEDGKYCVSNSNQGVWFVWVVRTEPPQDVSVGLDKAGAHSLFVFSKYFASVWTWEMTEKAWDKSLLYIYIYIYTINIKLPQC